MRRMRRAAAGLLLAALCLFAACSPQQASPYYVGFSLASLYVGGEAVSAREKEDVSASVTQLLHEIEDMVSAERADSDVARFNAASAGERVAVGEHTYALLSLCKELFAETGGAFSPALYNLSELWGFTPEFEGAYTRPRPEPSAEQIAGAAALSDFDDVILHEDGTVSKARDGVRIDLGGVAKGYMSDRAARLLTETFGSSVDAILSVMSNSVLMGHKRGANASLGYTASIENPRAAVTAGSGAGQGLFVIGLSDAAVSTSADTYRSYVYGGRIYSHIIDPSTGKPSENGVISIMVTVPRSVPYAGARADAYSTAGFCMPLTEALAFYAGLAEERGVGAVVITADWKFYAVGDCTALNRTEYAALVSPETEIEDIFVRSDAAAAEDAVVACAREEEYIRYVAERSGR